MSVLVRIRFTQSSSNVLNEEGPFSLSSIFPGLHPYLTRTYLLTFTELY